MGFISNLLKVKPQKTAGQRAIPAPVPATAGPDKVCAPVSGRVIPLEEIPDPVFSSGAMGRGCGVWPEDETAYAPVSGTVTAKLDHAAGILSDDGIEVLVHIGVDTVEMHDGTFTAHVSQGDRVEAGQPLISFSRASIERAGHPDVVVTVVSNSDEFADVRLAAPDGAVRAGNALLGVTRS